MIPGFLIVMLTENLLFHTNHFAEGLVLTPYLIFMAMPSPAHMCQELHSPHAANSEVD